MPVLYDDLFFDSGQLTVWPGLICSVVPRESNAANVISLGTFTGTVTSLEWVRGIKLHNSNTLDGFVLPAVWFSSGLFDIQNNGEQISVYRLIHSLETQWRFRR